MTFLIHMCMKIILLGIKTVSYQNGCYFIGLLGLFLYSKNAIIILY